MDQEFNDLLKEIQKDLRTVSDKVIEMAVAYKQHESNNIKNSERLDALERDNIMAKGSINVIKIVGAAISTLLLTSGISFCVWIVLSNVQLKQEILNLSKDIAIINTKISTNERSKNEQ